MMSIAMISDDFLPAITGVGIHLQALAPELVKRGHRVCVITTRRAGEPEREVWQGVRVHRCFTLTAYGFPQALPGRRRLRRIFAEERVSVVHHQYPGVMMLRAAAVARDLGLPEVHTWHVSPDVLCQPPPLRPLRGLFRGLMRRHCNRVGCLIAPSANLTGEIAAAGIVTPVETLTNPVSFPDPASVTPAARPTDADFVVLYAGRLGPEKNLPLLIAAFARLLENRPGAWLWIAGEGQERSRVEKQARDLGIDRRITLLGHVPHAALAGYFKACDVFVLPSKIETQGLVALEAMHFGRPLLVSRVIVSADDLVADGENGFRIDADDPQDLARRLVDLATDATLRERLGREATRRSQAWRPEAVAARTEHLYTALPRPALPARSTG